MPYKKILLNAFINFIQDKGVMLNAFLLLLVNMEVVEWIKLYALVLGAAYTTYKFYKEIVKEAGWWDAFKRWNAGLLNAIADVKRQKDEHDKEKEK